MGRPLVALTLSAFFLTACVGDVAAPPLDGGADSHASADAAVVLSIPTIRNPADPGHPSPGAFVKIEGAVVTGVKSTGATHGFFVQDPAQKAWAGFYIFVGPASVSVAVGAVVTATGVITAYKGLEQMDVSTGGYEQTGTVNPLTPLDVVPDDIRAGSSTAAQYQSMLLRVKAVKAKTATATIDFTVTSSAGNDDLIITSYSANDVGPSPFPATVGQTFTSIIGRGYKSGPTDQTAVAKLAPLGPSEVVTP